MGDGEEGQTVKMSGQILKSSARAVSRLHARGLRTTPACCKQVTLTSEQMEHMYPKTGNRDLVGQGYGGGGKYMDRIDYPCPAVRWGANTPEVMALREKEKDSWTKLTLEERKALYRASFRQTFAEMNAPTGEWKFQIAACLFACSITGLLTLWFEANAYPNIEDILAQDNKNRQLQRMVKQGQGIVEGIGSNYDYEKGDWK